MLSQNKVNQLKSQIHEQLQSQNVYSNIRQFLQDYMKTEGTKLGKEDSIIDALKEKGIVDEIVKSLNVPKTDPKPQLPVSASPTKKYLHVKIMGGKAFIDHLSHTMEDTTLSPNSLPNLVLHLHFVNQRFKCNPVPCTVEPMFDDSFLIELLPNVNITGKPADAGSLLHMNAPIHMVLVKHFNDGTSSLVGTHSLEWRKVLKTGSIITSVEFGGVGSSPKVPIGIIDFKLELLPYTPNVTVITENDITMQLRNERASRAESIQLFFMYAKAWWTDYLQIRKSHNHRLVKIFTQTENGTDMPVCSFLQPLRAGRLIDSPRHAARFVSLLAFEKEESLGGGSKDIWHTPHTFLAKGKGTVEDHAILLCCLLLGFGLDAYVAIGTDDVGAHVWVITKVQDGSVVFWESLTGVRYTQDDLSKKSTRYRTVECVFSNQSFYANAQPSDNILHTVFSFEDPALWKPMNPDAIIAVKGSPLPPLMAPTIQVIPMEVEIETALRHQIFEHRKNMGLTAIFDENLGYLLGQALSLYEMERILGVGIPNDEFQQSIKRAVPENHTFKGFPIQFLHRSPSRMMLAFLRAKACHDIFNSRGDQFRYALRGKVFVFPEDVTAFWVMVACKYINVHFG
eukprot:TRINITY_DN4355_c0_g1_i2.p1 TRINITY_DN4355_c0_g1~~TRINITY_DN4355_c0_g1_i2.p1  ORF type:complete len:624 (-),score=98.42 TRINITY_DN4355_c0_g1_i2:51-1922(-)